MDKNLDDNLLIIQATIDDSRQYHGWKMNKYYSKLDKLMAMIKKTMCRTPYVLVVMTVLNDIMS